MTMGKGQEDCEHEAEAWDEEDEEDEEEGEEEAISMSLFLSWDTWW
eukprot:CAMPEP_0201534290 /NCGR_PEP_ID=MMETSP0161_2-20130828/55837_1 /ASSEMBLY_ACC=CAM_ASM_000251 /TAXON_ID=180227 /ORGANISM="Neoparamoeba aestuarina, Strain SoJaBio B1-5/56/2" /LENGTH=45 /DNA_ID= /DNA_START= /DNA_END= /DNA_ORIENTATION=